MAKGNMTLFKGFITLRPGDRAWIYIVCGLVVLLAASGLARAVVRAAADPQEWWQVALPLIGGILGLFVVAGLVRFSLMLAGPVAQELAFFLTRTADGRT